MSEVTGRTLGLDVGERRIGVAISDPNNRLAVPLRAIERDRAQREFHSLGDIVRAEEVTSVVVGLPLSLSGEDSAQTGSARAFAEDLERRLDIPVVLWDERL